jgi:hypothetical protein
VILVDPLCQGCLLLLMVTSSSPVMSPVASSSHALIPNLWPGSITQHNLMGIFGTHTNMEEHTNTQREMFWDTLTLSLFCFLFYLFKLKIFADYKAMTRFINRKVSIPQPQREQARFWAHTDACTSTFLICNEKINSRETYTTEILPSTLIRWRCCWGCPWP